MPFIGKDWRSPGEVGLKFEVKVSLALFIVFISSPLGLDQDRGSRLGANQAPSQVSSNSP